MKKTILYSVILLTAFASCKETPPPIDFTDAIAVDSTYIVSPVPAAEPHNVLFEDFTGATCSNCPVAKSGTLDPLVLANPGRINVISLHVTDFVQTKPVSGARYDFRDSVATLIEQNVYSSLFGMPIAGIDRMPFGLAQQGSQYQVLKSGWVSSVQKQLAIQDSINLDVKSSYNSIAGEANIEVKVTYLYNMSSVQHISIAIVEDSLIDLQDDAATSEVIVDYKFDDVLRALVTSAPYGDPILSPSLLPTYPIKEAGRVYIRRYTYKVKPSLVVRHCKVVAFVHKDAAARSTMVMQSKQTPLSQ